MSVPKYDELYNSFLSFIEDGNVKSLAETTEYVTAFFNLSDEEKIPV